MTLTEISKLAESVEQFIGDLARAFREKRWVKILSLGGVVFALLLSPFGLDLVGLPRPRWYSYLVWIIVTGSFFVAAFLIALLTRQKEKTDLPPPTSIIKGLLAYTNTKEDADWFARLQRGNVLHDCLRFCLSTGSSFAILTGESGTGKTSFLQAGLSPRLEAQGQRAVCVKLTDSPPLDSICQSLNGHDDKPATIEQQPLLAVLRQAIRDDARPTVLILDQFEQFFTRNKSKPARKAFIEQMAEWHRLCDSLPVKILISIRDDFADQLSDFQKSMDYTLTAHNKLRLEKFEPQEAAQVIGVIAREAKIELDETFVRELTRHELADREEGTVSPVDIQILSWMLDGQKTSEERAFNRRAFQKLGGVEGLLERFLSRQLDARDTDARRQTVIKVMLALTDQNVRAGALSLKALKEKLGGVVPEREVEEAISWLARSEVRLVTQIQEKNDTLYELAHERIIAPLRRLAFKEISSVEKAQQTLDRRVNEWIGNNRARRYLLTFREWRLIKRHWPLIRLDSQKEQKGEFVALSKRRFVLTGASLAVVLVLGLGAYRGYAWYEARPQTQIDRAQKQLIALLNENKDSKAMEYASLLLAVLDAQKDSQLSQELWEQLKRRDSSDQATVLLRLGPAYIKLSKADDAVKVLSDVEREGRSLTSLSRHRAIESLAENYVSLSTLSRADDAIKGLERLRKMAEETESLWRIDAFEAVAGSYAELSKCGEASNIWDAAIHAIDMDRTLEERLQEWADGYFTLKMQCKERFAIDGLKKFKTLLAKFPPEERNKLERSLVGSPLAEDDEDKERDSGPSTDREIRALLGSANKIKSSQPDEAFRLLQNASRLSAELPVTDRVDVMFTLAETYVELSRTEEALRILEGVQPLAKANPNLHEENILWRLALRYGQLGRVDLVLPVLDKAETVEKPGPFSLNEFVDICGKMTDEGEATKGLQRVRPAIKTLPQSEQAGLLLILAQVYGKLKHIDVAEETLVEAQQAANAKSSDEKSLILAKIAAMYARLGKWARAVETAQAIGNERHVISALSRILIISRESRDGAKYLDALEEHFEELEPRLRRFP